MRLYDLFGYETYRLGIGQPGPTHALNLVRIEADGQRLLSLQDAYFNLTYVDGQSGAPLDVFDLLRRLREGRHTSVRTIEPEPENMPSLPALLVSPAGRGDRSPEQIARGAFAVLEADYEFVELPNGIWKFVSPRTFGKFLGKCREPDGRPRWYLKFLEDQGHPADMLYLFLYPFRCKGVSGYTPEAVQLLEQAQAIVAGRGD
jgi:hypothetical protein